MERKFSSVEGNQMRKTADFLFLDWDLRADKKCFEDNNRQFVAKKLFLQQENNRAIKQKRKVGFGLENCYRSPDVLQKFSEIRVYLMLSFLLSICFSTCIGWERNYQLHLR